MKKKFITLILTIFTAVQPIYAGEIKQAGIEKIDLTFEQAYQLMIENNNSLKAFNEAIKQSKYEKNAAVGEFFPKVGLNATYIHFANPITVSTDSHPPIPSITTLLQNENVFAANAGVIWNIFTGGKILALNSAARAKLEATNEKYNEVQDTLTVELVKRYYGLRLARDVVAVRKQVAEGIKKHLDDAKLLEREGLIAKSERLHAEVAYSEALRDYKSSMRDANVIEEGLKTLIKADTANLKDVSISPQSLLFVYENSTINLEEMKINALQNNPQLKQLRAKKKIMNAKFRGEIANYSPTVSLFAYDVFSASDLSEQVPRWAVGGTVNFTVFDGLARYNKVKAADSGRKMVDYEIADSEYNVESLVTKQYQELMKYRELYDSTSTSIENTKEALRTVSLGFKEGFRTSLEVVDAELALSKVKIERLNSLYNYDSTLAELLKTNGNTKDIINYITTSKTEKF